ncbi:MAG TPA: hypothetical protein VFO07_05525 [Roseiflexaceae bacterium]|nr:hypothetical protein [Roseiflexaceae bacterium]
MDASCKRLIVPGLVDSPLKLQLLLMFYRHPRLCGEAGCLNDWLHASPWAIEEALDALAETDLLVRIEQHGRILYRLEQNTWLSPWLHALAHCYDDPLRRDQVYTLVREADRERQFRAWVVAVQQPTFEAVW